ncbi:hypothetical protein CACET_c21220 [Clostridium aceticum]|uniref:Uncharacterized protein n=2 Tax=Clostridium aceticum TaxID=84022 RepID=A0A0D8IA06_9CLOT|nr:hypothetical protein CACET_c21220 [Clostridium aceticum]KJF26852.1 hypothetical protein TZ02_11655 [Clostridium aceticum]
MKSILLEARRKTYDNSVKLIYDAKLLFYKEKYALATFCAMTAIEEIGKFVFLHTIGTSNIIKLDTELSSHLMKEITKVLKDYSGKVLEVVNWSLYINAAADRRHGIHPSGIYRTSGVVLLARSGKWAEVRNRCLYTDINLTNTHVVSPEKIGKEHAYYFICMAYEGLAAQVEAGLDVEIMGIEGRRARDELINLEMDLIEFIEISQTNVDELDFIKNSQKYKNLAEQRKEIIKDNF